MKMVAVWKNKNYIISKSNAIIISCNAPQGIHVWTCYTCISCTFHCHFWTLQRVSLKSLHPPSQKTTTTKKTKKQKKRSPLAPLDKTFVCLEPICSSSQHKLTLNLTLTLTLTLKLSNLLKRLIVQKSFLIQEVSTLNWLNWTSGFIQADCNVF